jgi:hypothetical protein
MKPNKANSIYSTTLILVGTWGYLTHYINKPIVEPFVLTPVFVGLFMLLFNYWIKQEKKFAIAIVAFSTLCFLPILTYFPLFDAIEHKDIFGIVRVSIQIIIGMYAMVYYVKWFLEWDENNNIN